MLPAPLKFSARVTEYRPRNSKNKKKPVVHCPGPTPAWLSTAKANGVVVDLAGVVAQAGRHFASSANPANAGVSGVTARQFSNTVAWYLMSMLDPHLNAAGELILSPTGDPDVQRVAMELFGVGGALELLRSLKVVDGRTLRKLAGRFDFEATLRGQTSKVLIEVKGTLDDASRGAHQRSIRDKLNDTTHVPTRGYSRAIGVIFFGWTTKTGARREDFQIADPEFDESSSPEPVHRAIVAHYADLFETAGLQEAADRLRSVSESEGWPPPPARLRELIGEQPSLIRHRFSRTHHIVVLDGEENEYWGGYWDARYAPPLIQLGEEVPARFAFVGVDARVPQLVADGRFSELVELSCPRGTFTLGPVTIDVLRPPNPAPATGSFAAVVHATGEGALYVWSTEIPSQLVALAGDSRTNRHTSA